MATERVDHTVGVIVDLTHAARKRAHAKNIHVARQHRRGFAHVFGLVGIHHRAVLGLQLPDATALLQRHGHATELVHGDFEAGARAQGRVEEQHAEHLALEQGARLIALVLGGQLDQRRLTLRAKVLQVGEMAHRAYPLNS